MPNSTVAAESADEDLVEIVAVLSDAVDDLLTSKGWGDDEEIMERLDRQGFIDEDGGVAGLEQLRQAVRDTKEAA